MVKKKKKKKKKKKQKISFKNFFKNNESTNY